MSLKSRLARMERAAPRTADNEPPAEPIDWTPALAAACAEAYGPDDPRGDADYLRTLPKAEQLGTYRLAMAALVKHQPETPEMAAYRALTLEEKVHFLRTAIACKSRRV